MAEPEIKQAMETTEVSDDGEHEDIEDPDSEQAGDHGQQNELTTQLMKNPQVLAALQDRLGGMVGSPSGYIQSLPKVVKRRIKALKKLQLECTKLEAKFYEEVHSLECKYAQMYQPLYDKRKDIVNAIVEPTDPECEWPSDDEHEDELADNLKNKIKLEEKKEESVEPKVEENPKGISEFWLTIFKNVDLLAEMVQDHDEPILKSLQDIKVKFSDTPPLAFTLEFMFSPNDYFTNTVLTKHYEMKCFPDESDPFSFEGPEIIKSSGCTIDWKKGKNVTVKVIKKKQKHKSRGAVRTVTKTVQNDSFFNFFNPPSVPDGEDTEVDEELQQLINADFEIGHFIRDRIVPRAVLYFTGEALEEDEYDEDGEEEDNLEGEEEDDENDPDYNPQNDMKAKKQPAECKQQ